jgi:hypothetical protein
MIYVARKAPSDCGWCISPRFMQHNAGWKREATTGGEAEGNGGEVKLATEYAAIEVGVVGWMKEGDR